jgi:hypothetical protein
MECVDENNPLQMKPLSTSQICASELDKEKPEYTLEDLIAYAEELIEETLTAAAPSQFEYAAESGHSLAFYDYPLAKAYR